ncbi:MAG: nucleoside triphosphate pyrophosphohydrolase [Bacteroidota bacterium]|jgi:XTP/dITP diphosphohydrolase
MTDAQIAFDRLLNVMDELREKCPWDKKQTIQTLRTLTIEEMYELTDAVLNDDWDNIKKELGDVLLHLVFYARIAKEENKFTVAEMINELCEKLIVRHPHIYGDVKVNDENDVKKNWEQIKLKEGSKSVLGGVPKGLPAMVKAHRIQEKAKQVGFEWDTREQVWDKIEEEIAELKEAVANNNMDEMENEMGDVLFSFINYARFIGVDSETALERTNRKFINRFSKMETAANKAGKNLAEMTLTEMDAMWNEIKKLE